MKLIFEYLNAFSFSYTWNNEICTCGEFTYCFSERYINDLDFTKDNENAVRENVKDKVVWIPWQ